MNEHQEFQQLNEKNNQFQIKEFKLPKIERIQSRGQTKQIKSSTKLPILKTQSQADSNQSVIQMKTNEEDDFVGHVQRKLRLIMEQQNIIQIAQSEESDGDNFQKKINKNKEIIKRAKRKNQRNKKENQMFHNRDIIKKFSQKMKWQSNQKKHREFREITAENKNQTKKKELLYNTFNKNALKDIKDQQKDVPKSGVPPRQNNNINIRQLKEIKSKDQITPLNKMMPNQVASNRQPIPSTQKRKIKKQLSQKQLSPVQKNEQLFDAIHNYLQNPKRPEVEISTEKIIKQKLQLQQKLKQYETKLTNAIEFQPKPKQVSKKQNDQPEAEKAKMVASTQWRKIDFAEHDIKKEITSFQKEVDRIGLYLSRNEKSLQKYIQNQKILIDLHIVRRQSSKQRYESIDKENAI